jgi:hypothetical protein
MQTLIVCATNTRGAEGMTSSMSWHTRSSIARVLLAWTVAGRPGKTEI